ncbi:MAG TPA: XRE family transcriptional regulator [Gemmatimonadaceae bacterium]|nr:XRE family transcriptional regulator [Gemmatimonadaceae bacterium]
MDVTAVVQAMSSFSAERLTLAREAANLEVKELADLISATPSAISQLENERTRPKAETLLRLSVALAVPPQFFGAGAPPSMPAHSCHFRRRKGATKREQRYVLARGRLIRELVGYLEDRIQFPQEGMTALHRAPSDRSEIEDLTRSVREAWGLGLGPISDMVALLELHGALPVEVRGHSEQLDAFSTWADGRPMIFLSMDKNCASRRRFDAAHELGHLIMHSGLSADAPSIEREADQFASALLLPQSTFLAECPNRLSWNALLQMKRRWGVSLLAIVRRAFELGLYSEATYRRAHVQYARFGWRAAGEPDEPRMEIPTILADAAKKLISIGISIPVMAADLKHSERLVEDALWPRGRRTAH